MSKTLHLRHFHDGYPLCWPMDRDGPFDATSDEHAVTCTDCRAILHDFDTVADSETRTA